MSVANRDKHVTLLNFPIVLSSNSFLVTYDSQNYVSWPASYMILNYLTCMWLCCAAILNIYFKSVLLTIVTNIATLTC